MKNTRPGQPVTSNDATNGPLTAVSPADHAAPMPGRFTEPALWALVIRHARCSDGGLDPDQWFPASADRAGPSGSSLIRATGTSQPRAATSPPSSSRRRSSTRCAPPSGRSAEPRPESRRLNKPTRSAGLPGTGTAHTTNQQQCRLRPADWRPGPPRRNAGRLNILLPADPARRDSARRRASGSCCLVRVCVRGLS